MTAPLSPIATWSFPFTAPDGQALTDPQRCLAILRQAQGGTYPIGQNALWHGGVHFDAGNLGLVDAARVRCLADGEVIAYRID